MQYLPKPYSHTELRALRPALRGWPGLLEACDFLVLTGLRSAEFAGISSEAVRSWPRPPWWCRRRGCRRHRTTHRLIGKGSKERMIPLPPAALRAAHRLLEHSENGHLLPWPERTFRHHLRLAGQRVGVHAHPHRFRHSFATALVEGGAPIEVVADLMGHVNVNITRVYYRLSEERAFRAIRRRR